MTFPSELLERLYRTDALTHSMVRALDNAGVPREEIIVQLVLAHYERSQRFMDMMVAASSEKRVFG